MKRKNSVHKVLKTGMEIEAILGEDKDDDSEADSDDWRSNRRRTTLKIKNYKETF